MNKRIEIGLVALTLSIMATSVSADSLWGQLKKRVKNEVENVRKHKKTEKYFSFKNLEKNKQNKGNKK